MDSPQDNPLKHLGVCLSLQDREYQEVVQAAEHRKKAWKPERREIYVEWKWDFSSFDIFGWFASDTDGQDRRLDHQSQDPQRVKEADDPETVDSLKLFTDLSRLQEHHLLVPSLVALAQAVRCAGHQRCSMKFLQRETAKLLFEVENQALWTSLEDAGPQKAIGSETTLECRHHGLSSSCSTASTSVRSTTGACADGQRVSSNQATECTSHSRSPSDVSLDFSLDNGPAAQDVHSWELEFLCSAAADALWRRLRVNDSNGAMHIVVKVSDEILRNPGPAT
mmetsp:Transcript_41236/g.76706  ORF Transcript_41236/g.76706 Transcript_41236/m.76706 type:complete len:280 (+) Transcript_41236:47-886(+)